MSDFLRNVTLRGAGRFSGSRVDPAPVPSVLLRIPGSASERVAGAVPTPAQAPAAPAPSAAPEVETDASEVVARDREPTRVAPRGRQASRRREAPKEIEAPAPASDRQTVPSPAHDDVPSGRRRRRPGKRAAPWTDRAEEHPRPRARVDEPPRDEGSGEASVIVEGGDTRPPARMSRARTRAGAPTRSEPALQAPARDASRLQPEEQDGPASRAARATAPAPAATAASTAPEPDPAPLAIVEHDAIRGAERVIDSGEPAPDVAEPVRAPPRADPRSPDEPSPDARAHVDAPLAEDRPERAVSVIEAPGDAAGERRNDEHRRDEPGSASTNGTGSKESRPVEVRIGTIEVSSASSPEPAPGMAPPPSLKGFDDHLYVRSYIDIARL